MTSKTFSPHIALAHRYWKEHLNPGDIAIDMTCGNGHDALYLSQLLPLGKVYGFDIQAEAIEATRKRTNGAVELIHSSHEEIDRLLLPKSPRLIVYNLGYLPGNDHSIVTKAESTLTSLEKAIALLSPGGAISITCYPGHEEGEIEERAVLDFAKKLSWEKWSVCHHRWLNRLKSPSLLWLKVN